MKNSTNQKTGYIIVQEKFSKCLFIIILMKLSFFFTLPIFAQGPMIKKEKSPALATSISFLGTAVPIVLATTTEGGDAAIYLMTSGIALGPALGYIYTEDLKNGFKQAGVRTLVIGTSIGIAAGICAAGDCSLGLFGGTSGPELELAATTLLIGYGTAVILAVSDINRVGKLVCAHNQKLIINPAYFPETQVAGMRMIWKF